jgi:hypothetical protein
MESRQIFDTHLLELDRTRHREIGWSAADPPLGDESRVSVDAADLALDGQAPPVVRPGDVIVPQSLC